MKIILNTNEIKEEFGFPLDVELEISDYTPQQNLTQQILDSKTINDELFIVTFPGITAKEFINSVDNKTTKGKLVYSNWMNDEDFYTKEKMRKGIFQVSKKLIGMGKTWNECKELVEKEQGVMLNFAEYMYVIYQYDKETNGKSIHDTNWSWTSSRDSGGGLVSVGDFDSDGAGVSNWSPRDSGSYLGVCFSRSEIMNND